MILLAGFVDFIQEFKAHKLNQKLKVLVSNNFFVLNQEIIDISIFNFNEASKNLIQINQNNLVIGDVISLKQGDLVPADARVI